MRRRETITFPVAHEDSELSLKKEDVFRYTPFLQYGYRAGDARVE